MHAQNGCTCIEVGGLCLLNTCTVCALTDIVYWLGFWQTLAEMVTEAEGTRITPENLCILDSLAK